MSWGTTWAWNMIFSMTRNAIVLTVKATLAPTLKLSWTMISPPMRYGQPAGKDVNVTPSNTKR